MGCFPSQPLQKTNVQKSTNVVLGSFSSDKQDDDPRLVSSSRTGVIPIPGIIPGGSEQPTQVFEWVLSKEIGKGSRSHVFLAKNVETQQICAAKLYDKHLLIRPTLKNADPPYVAVQREIEIMAALDHRYILSAKEVIEDDVSDTIIILMKYAERGTLQNLLDAGKFTDELIPICFLEIAESLRYIHSLNIVHRDIKPDNMLVFSNTSFVLSDFSVSMALSKEDERLDDTMGSPAFLSPEECEKEPFSPKPADVWSYGISLYYTIFKKFPFNLDKCISTSAAYTAVAVSRLLASEELKFPAGTDLNSEAILLVSSILVKDPLKRPTFEEIVKDKYFDRVRHIDEENIKIWEKLREEENKFKVEIMSDVSEIPEEEANQSNSY